MTNLVEKITYNYEDFIDDIIIIDPDMVHRGPTIGKKPNGIHWKTIKDQIISSHYNLHFGHCIQLGAQSFTSLMADLRQNINRVHSFKELFH